MAVLFCEIYILTKIIYCFILTKKIKTVKKEKACLKYIPKKKKSI